MVDGEEEIQEHEEVVVSSVFNAPEPIEHPVLSMLLETANIPAGDIPTVSASLIEQGFDTVMVLKEATVAMLLQYCAGLKPGAALAIITVAKADAEQVNGEVIAHTQPDPTLIDSHNERIIEIEKRRLAGEIGMFPMLNSNLERHASIRILHACSGMIRLLRSDMCMRHVSISHIKIKLSPIQAIKS